MRLGELREERHRMIHDAMEVGIEDTPDGGYRVILLREGYVRKGKRTTHHQLTGLTPDDVAGLAHRYYDARVEIDGFVGRLYDAGGVINGDVVLEA
jgi:hypothetical protein